jgi:hypothetical protein
MLSLNGIPACNIYRLDVGEMVSHLAWDQDYAGSSPAIQTIILRRLFLDKRTLRIKYKNKKVNAIKEGIEFKLSIDDYEKLIIDADISIDDIGNKGYHLSRYNDCGPYEIGNCRFIYYIYNLREKKISDKSRKSSSNNIIKYMSNRSESEKIIVQNMAANAIRNKIKNGINIKPSCSLSEQEIKRRIDIINNSGVDMNKYGWVTKISNILECSHTAVKRFVNKYYRGKFYRRSSRTKLNPIESN